MRQYDVRWWVENPRAEYDALMADLEDRHQRRVREKERAAEEAKTGSIPLCELATGDRVTMRSTFYRGCVGTVHREMFGDNQRQGVQWDGQSYTLEYPTHWMFDRAQP